MGADAERDALIGELTRIYERLSTSGTTTTTAMGFIFVIFAGGLVAAEEIPEAFVVIPLFWSVWVLYILMIDRETIVYSAYAQYLEQRLESHFTSPIFLWEGRVLNRHQTSRPYLVSFTYAYWCLPGILVWVIAVMIFHHEHEPLYAILSAVMGTSVWTTALIAVIRRGHYSKTVRQFFRELALNDVAAALGIKPQYHTVHKD